MSSLFDVGRFAEFALSSGGKLVLQQAIEGATLRISEPRPDEVKNLVQQDQAQEAAIAEQLGFENDSAYSNEAGGMHGRAAMGRSREQTTSQGGEFGKRTNVNRATGQFRQPDQDLVEERCETATALKGEKATSRFRYEAQRVMELCSVARH